VHIIGVEAQNLYEFSEVLSPAIQAAIPIAANKTVQLLEKISKEHSN
jgi:Ni,Fe-hydrogenase maturation factor